jgi:uncharacterized protein (DUF1684 family)
MLMGTREFASGSLVFCLDCKQFLNMKPRFVVLLVLFFEGSLAFGQNPEFERWKQNRNEELVAEDGWVNLAGLLWISPGSSYLYKVGKDSMAIARQAGKQTVGTFQVRHDSVWFSFHPKALKRNKIKGAPLKLQFPVEHYEQGELYFERWKWTVINRGGQFAMRLRDLKHPALANFDPIDTYEYNPDWRLDAIFEPKFNQLISITNVLGQVIEWRVMGILKFEIKGKQTELITLEDEGKLFVIFSDQTSGETTYPSGRYLYVAFPNKSGKTFIDFNYAYNPPCAYTPFATCPLPPKENRLDFLVEVGEKAPDVH